MNIWITSDTHYGHINITGPDISVWKSGYRDFKTVSEMNMALVEAINNNVKEDDILYHLGDWSFGGVHNIFYFRKSIICNNVHLIKGNHDQHIKNKIIKFNDSFFNPLDLFSSVQNTLEIEYNKSYLFMNHYPHLSWHKSGSGSIMLHGHTHGTYNDINKDTNRMDVGIDSAKLILGEFRPFNIKEIIEIMNKK